MARKPTGQPAGRRTRTPGVLADHSLRIKLTALEHEQLRERAAAAGCGSVAEYVRSRCLSD